MDRLVSLAVVVAMVSLPTLAAADEPKRPDLAAKAQAPTGLLPPPPPPPKTSTLLTATATGVIIGAGLMLIATTKTDKPKSARNLNRGGLAFMIVLPLAGLSADMAESSTWEAVPAR